MIATKWRNAALVLIAATALGAPVRAELRLVDYREARVGPGVSFAAFCRRTGEPLYAIVDRGGEPQELVFLSPDGEPDRSVVHDMGAAKPSDNERFVGYYYCSRPPCEEYEDPHFANRSLLVHDERGREVLVIRALPSIDFAVSNTGRFAAGVLQEAPGRTGPELYIYSDEGRYAEKRLGYNLGCGFSPADSYLVCVEDQMVGDRVQQTMRLLTRAGNELWNKGAERFGLWWFDPGEQWIIAPFYTNYKPGSTDDADYGGIIAVFGLDGAGLGAMRFQGLGLSYADLAPKPGPAVLSLFRRPPVAVAAPGLTESVEFETSDSCYTAHAPALSPDRGLVAALVELRGGGFEVALFDARGRRLAAAAVDLGGRAPTPYNHGLYFADGDPSRLHLKVGAGLHIFELHGM